MLRRVTTMIPRHAAALAAGVLLFTALAVSAYTADDPPARGAEVTLKGSMVCNGACVLAPKEGDHVMVLFAIDGTAEVRADVDKIMKDFYPEEGLARRSEARSCRQDPGGASRRRTASR